MTSCQIGTDQSHWEEETPAEKMHPLGGHAGKPTEHFLN